MIQPDYILLFENEYFRSLYPFYLLHCQWEIRCGAFRLFEKIQKQFPNAKLLYHSNRENYLRLFNKRFSIEEFKIERGNLLVLNAGILPSRDFWQNLNKAYSTFVETSPTTSSVVFSVNSVPIAFYLISREMVNPIDFDKNFYSILMSKYFEKLSKVEIPIPKVINFLWDAIEYNSEAIADDFRFFDNFADFYELKRNKVELIEENNIRIGKNTKIMPWVVLNAEKGPIIIDDEVTIQPFSYIEGPVAIGKKSLIKAGSFIYGGTSIGELCKIGGEVENTIFHSFSNKQHYGFFGHSYVGQWCNIGAGTTTSDLKNTYEGVSVRIENEIFNTGRTFLGLLCGDHTRTAINTTFNTGTITGICCNIYHSGLLPKYIPSFTWGGTRTESTLGSFERTIQSIETMMKRRNAILLEEERKILELEYQVQIKKRKN